MIHYSRKLHIYFIGNLFATVVAKASLIVFENFSFVSRVFKRLHFLLDQLLLHTSYPISLL